MKKTMQQIEITRDHALAVARVMEREAKNANEGERIMLTQEGRGAEVRCHVLKYAKTSTA